jgi:2-methylaconitate cis-trans-isomerase PrpF
MPDVRERLLRIREAAGAMAGLADEHGGVPAHVPKLALVAPPGGYTGLSGRSVGPGDADLRAWALTMGQLHQAYPVTAGMATAVAARMQGTVAHEIAASIGTVVRIGHPSGVISIGADVLESPDGPIVERVVVGRTARRLMAGEITLP